MVNVMKHIWKKTTAMVLLTAMLCMFAAGCGKQGGGEASGDGSGKLVYWSGFTGDSQTWDEKRIQNFMKENKDIEVDMQSVPESAGIKNGKLLSAIAGGTAPDIICADDFAAAYAFATNSSFEKWDPYMEFMGLDKKDFLPAYQELMDYKGSIYLLPQDSNVLMLFYNPKHFAEAGLDPEQPPRTIEELDAYAEKLTVQNGSEYSRFGYIPWIDSGEEPFVLPFVWGSEIYNADSNKINITDEPMISLFSWMQGYADKYNPEKINSFTSGFGGMFSPDHPFMTEKVSMTVTGNWFTHALKAYSPDTEYRVAPIPTADESRYGSSPLNSNVFAMPKGCKNPKAAARLFQYCVDPVVNEDNFAQWRSIPVMDSAFDEVSWTKNGDEIYALEREIANHEKSGHPALCKTAAQMGDDLKKARDSVIYTGADPKGTLKKLQDTMQEEQGK